MGDQIIEALEAHSATADRDGMERVRELFDLVSLDPSFIMRYPHEYSGGMRQRAIIAMALACEPDIMIADEPTTALDVIVQDRILREMQAIQRSLDMSMIYISHDMAVIAEVCDVVGVMYAGKLVEFGPTAEVYARPIHPYTRALMSAFPSVRGEKHDLATLPGEPPDLLDPPSRVPLQPAVRVRDGRVPRRRSRPSYSAATTGRSAGIPRAGEAVNDTASTTMSPARALVRAVDLSQALPAVLRVGPAQP